MWETTTRNPLLFQSFCGLFLFRFAHRQLSAVLLNDPPRKTHVSKTGPRTTARHAFDGLDVPALTCLFELGGFRPHASMVWLIHPPSKSPISFTIRVA